MLDKIKESRSLASDNALAKVLGVSRNTVSQWRHDIRLPEPVMCEKLADMSGEPLAKVLGMVGEARAISAAEKSVWRRLAQAAGFLLPFVLAAGIAGPGRAEPGQVGPNRMQQNPDRLLIMRTWLGRLARLARRLLSGTPLNKEPSQCSIFRHVAQMAA